ncbi:hypothetical protein EV702DRAFT_415342 [Suillus placidus]|uniref:Uncharacterized protein n=1 Tax=Suillus placidus TaxID=48579 RepID=A0A9P6ZT48_9AGAM|nr:hypothetical protein EV702DRAFT_415342 [Suillus placidus]
MPVEYRQAFSMAYSPLQHVVPILFLLRTTLAMPTHPFLPIHVRFSIAFRRSSTNLAPMLMKQPNSSNAQGAPSSLAVLVLSKLLQYRTERHCMLLHGRGRSSKTNLTSRARRRNLSLPPPRRPPHLLKVPALPQQVQPHSHHLSHCWLVSYCFSAAHLPRTPMVINTGAAYVQSFYFSRLPIFHQSCFLVVRLMQCIELG